MLAFILLAAAEPASESALFAAAERKCFAPTKEDARAKKIVKIDVVVAGLQDDGRLFAGQFIDGRAVCADRLNIVFPTKGKQFETLRVLFRKVAREELPDGFELVHAELTGRLFLPASNHNGLAPISLKVLSARNARIEPYTRPN